MLGEKVALTSVRLLASHLKADYQLQEQPQVFKEANFISGARKEITGFFLLR